MKIIGVSNFDDESVSDDLIVENVTEFYADKIAKFLNEELSGPYDRFFYKAVANDHKLYKFEP